jgi:hypothetical protein
MVKMRSQWLLPNMKHWTLKKMLRVELSLAPRHRMSKLTRRLKEMRCEGSGV